MGERNGKPRVPQRQQTVKPYDTMLARLDFQTGHISREESSQKDLVFWERSRTARAQHRRTMNNERKCVGKDVSFNRYSVSLS